MSITMPAVDSPACANPFFAHREDFERDLDAYYATCPQDVSRLVARLDRLAAERADLDSCGLKALVYETAAEHCDVQVFRYCPFYFEVQSGRTRHQWGFDGLGGWVRERQLPLLREEIQQIREDFGPFFHFNAPTAPALDDDHHSVGYDNVLRRGLIGIQREAQERLGQAAEPSRQSFYRSVIAGCAALIRLAEKFGARARELLGTETDPVARHNLDRVARSAAAVPAHPPRTFYEALNTLLFMRETVGSLDGVGISTFGHVDRLLFPFYQREIASGSLTPQEAKALLSAFLLYTETRFETRTARHETSTTIVVGGCDADGGIIYNDITRMILESYLELRLMEPKLHVRVTRRHPPALFHRCAALLAHGRNVLALFNDDVVIAANVQAGRAIEDARLYVAGGCQENKLQNCEINSRAMLYMNLPKLIEVGFFPGQAESLGRKSGFAVASFRECGDFEQLYDATQRNARALAEALVRRRNRLERRSVEINPCPLLSSTLDDCLARGLDMTAGGTRYAAGSIGLTGMGTLIDSLTAIRRLVFEDRTLGVDELAGILAANYEGHEPLRQHILRTLPKYGGREPGVAAFAGRVFGDMARATSGFPNGRGGVYEASLFSHMSYQSMGSSLMATPDGRRKGEHVSKGVGPSFLAGGGVWPLGETLDSLKTVDFTKFPVIGILDLRLSRIEPARAGELIVPVILRFLENRGCVLQINCLDASDLKRAQETPSAYPDLIVRVSGFSAQFTTLSREIQNEIINRSECSDSSG